MGEHLKNTSNSSTIFIDLHTLPAGRCLLGAVSEESLPLTPKALHVVSILKHFLEVTLVDSWPKRPR